MFNNILVGLDGSERQPAILRQAIELADRCGGKLHLCQAMQVPVSIPALAWSFQGDDFQGFLIEHAKKTLERVAQRVPDELLGKTWAELGQPADVLCRLAAENDFDLIVIGSHGYDGIDRLLGTTAAKVTNRAPCSVVIVRERER